MPNHTPAPTHPPASTHTAAPTHAPAPTHTSTPAHTSAPTHAPAPAPAPVPAPAALAIAWTGPANAQVSAMTPAQYDNQDPRTWHETKVKHFQQTTPALASATKARIRAAAHAGGTDPNEPEHITVSYKQGNKDINSPKKGAWHVYTGR